MEQTVLYCLPMVEVIIAYHKNNKAILHITPIIRKLIIEHKCYYQYRKEKVIIIFLGVQ